MTNLCFRGPGMVARRTTTGLETEIFVSSQGLILLSAFEVIGDRAHSCIRAWQPLSVLILFSDLEHFLLFRAQSSECFCVRCNVSQTFQVPVFQHFSPLQRLRSQLRRGSILPSRSRARDTTRTPRGTAAMAPTAAERVEQKLQEAQKEMAVALEDRLYHARDKYTDSVWFYYDSIYSNSALLGFAPRTFWMWHVGHDGQQSATGHQLLHLWHGCKC